MNRSFLTDAADKPASVAAPSGDAEPAAARAAAPLQAAKPKKEKKEKKAAPPPAVETNEDLFGKAMLQVQMNLSILNQYISATICFRSI